MTVMQRAFIFRLVVGLLATAAFVVIWLWTRNPLQAMKAWAIFALWALEFVLYPRKKRFLDERDTAILHRSFLIGYSVFWVFFVAGSFTCPYWAPPSASLLATWVASFPLAGACLLLVAQSAVGLALYARGS